MIIMAVVITIAKVENTEKATLLQIVDTYTIVS